MSSLTDVSFIMVDRENDFWVRREFLAATSHGTFLEYATVCCTATGSSKGHYFIYMYIMYIVYSPFYNVSFLSY